MSAATIGTACLLAGCGAGAAIAFLYDCTDDQIEHAVEYALAIKSGIICDGA